MNPDWWRQISAIYEGAVARAGADRASYLAEVCGADEKLRRDVESLLTHGTHESFLGSLVPLPPGNRLGAYELIEVIGAGGMGIVYRARDLKLQRDVALKVLPDAVALDPDRTARFRREAQVLASLNHPNIAAIHGFEDSGDVHALVLELVEGPTLADRIAQGPIPLDEALPIARQIADALEAAHEQGIIHRDLKPANIKLRPDGTVKVLDFGLAKARESVTAVPHDPRAASLSPTITSPVIMSGVGILLGTAAYMSPEQAKGRPADRRSDIWAFGCVFYEMLVGRRPFSGDDITETLAAVVKEEPEWNALPASLSPTLRAYLRRWLHKDPKGRVGDIRDVRLALAGAFDVPVPATATEPSRLTGLRQAWPWVAAAVVLSAGVTGVVMRGFMAVPAQQPVRRLEQSLPRSLELTPGNGTLLALSADGQTLVYRAHQNGVWRAYRRALDELQAQPIAGTENLAESPFLSADGRWVGFMIGSDLMKVSFTGGRPVRMGELPSPGHRGERLGGGQQYRCRRESERPPANPGHGRQATNAHRTPSWPSVLVPAGSARRARSAVHLIPTDSRYR